MKVLYEKETENVSRETFSVSFLRKKLFSLISCGSLWSKVIQTSTRRGFYAMLSLLSRSSAGAGSAMGKAAFKKMCVSIQATWAMNLRNPVPAETRSGRAFE